MATYVTYTPSSLIAKAMFNFDVSGQSNFKYSGTIAVSVSDSFGYYDWYYDVVNNIDYTMYPLSPEFSWTQSDLSNIQGALSILSDFANLNFSAVADYSTGGIYTPAAVGLAGVSDINIAFNYRDSRFQGESGICLDSNFGYSGARGDILINYNGSSFTDGKDFAEFTKSRQVLLHEIGHSLGLSHPHYPQNVLTSDYAALVTAGFQNLGFVINSPSDLNKEYFSIMSYDDQSDISLNNAYTPMILDVIALQEAYGEGQGTSGTGNDVIQAGYIGYRTYFDKGGIDTIDASLYSAGCYLNMGVSISGAPHEVGLLVNNADALNLFMGTGLPQSLRWLYGEYENAIGSSSVDLIQGNNLDNVIDAGGGDDFINGEDGNDTIYGGIGNDTIDCGGGSSDCVSYSYARQNYTITHLSGTYTVTAKSGSEGIDSVNGVESFQFSDQLVAASSVIDTTPPTIAISSNKGTLKAGETATITFTLSEASTDFVVGDVSVSGGTLSSFSGSGTAYSATFTPANNSTTNGAVSVASTKFTDAAGNSNADGADLDNTVTMTVNTLINHAYTGGVTISGTKAQGQTLTASNTLADADGLGSISYQWKANNVDIGGATSSTYRLTQSEVGKAIKVTASYTDAGGTAESANSVNTSSIANAQFAPTGGVTISGTAAQNQTLTANTSLLADADGLGTLSYVWKMSGKAISGATASTYALTQAHVGKAITVVVSYKDGDNKAETVTSAATSSVVNVNDAPTVAISISTKTAIEGKTFSLTIPTNTFADLDKDTLTYTAKLNGTLLTNSDWLTLASGKLTATKVPYTAADTANTVTGIANDGHGGTVFTSFALNVTNTSTINGTAANDAIVAGNGNDIISGLAGNDSISGGSGNDTLNGGVGNDTLTGGDGTDYFVLNAALNATSNRDTITDFSSGDHIQLENAVFKKLLVAGTLNAANFVSGVAVDANDYILYNSSTGVLSYDADGNGAGAAVQIALIGTSTHAALTCEDFVVI